MQVLGQNLTIFETLDEIRVKKTSVSKTITLKIEKIDATSSVSTLCGLLVEHGHGAMRILLYVSIWLADSSPSG
jgi:hypothetical protein